MTDEERSLLKRLGDRVAIEEVARCYVRALDGRNLGDADLFDACMLEDVEVDYDFGSWKGVAAHKQVHQRALLDVFTMTQHVLSNPVIEIDGDTATARYYVTAAHGIRTGARDKIVLAGAIYEHNLVRSSRGWRIRRHRCRTTWVDDEGGLMAAVSTGFASQP